MENHLLDHNGEYVPPFTIVGFPDNYCIPLLLFKKSQCLTIEKKLLTFFGPGDSKIYLKKK